MKYVKTTDSANYETIYGKVILKGNLIAEHTGIEIEWIEKKGRNINNNVCSCICIEITEKEYLIRLVLDS